MQLIDQLYLILPQAVGKVLSIHRPRLTYDHLHSSRIQPVYGRANADTFLYFIGSMVKISGICIPNMLIYCIDAVSIQLFCFLLYFKL